MRDNVLSSLAAIVAIFAFFVVLIVVVGIPDRPAQEAESIEVKRLSRDVTVILDPETGCQYLRAVGYKSLSVTPRMDASGKQICASIEGGAQ